VYKEINLEMDAKDGDDEKEEEVEAEVINSHRHLLVNSMSGPKVHPF
jgi:hypothetical protein